MVAIAAWMLSTACGDNRGAIDAMIVTEGSSGGDYCNPYQNVACNPGTRCTYVHEGAGQALDCYPVGSIAIGDACIVTVGRPDDCVAGAYCVDGVCRRLCDLSLAPCPSTQTCQPLLTTPPSGICVN